MSSMKKALIFIFTIILCLPVVVKAAPPEITNLSADYANNKVTVKGDTDSRVVALAVFLEDSAGTDLRMVTDGVENDNTFNTEINISNLEVGSTYKVRVANYNGGDYFDTTFTVLDNPNTNDNIIYSFVIGGISIIGIATCIYFLKKKTLKSE